MKLLVATQSEVLVADLEGGEMVAADGIDRLRPTCLATDPRVPGRAWCGTERGGVLRSDDGGASWRPAGLPDRAITALTPSPAEANVVWVGTEPSEVWRSDDGGSSWQPTRPLQELPSSGEWAFPPRPETHHVRWIACHPQQAGRLWIAVEAGALVSTSDGGQSWRDRVPGGPRDTHELAIHPDRAETLRALPATVTSRAAMAARAGPGRVPGWRSATCAASPSIRAGPTSCWSPLRRTRTPPASPATRTGGSTAAAARGPGSGRGRVAGSAHDHRPAATRQIPARRILGRGRARDPPLRRRRLALAAAPRLPQIGAPPARARVGRVGCPPRGCACGPIGLS